MKKRSVPRPKEPSRAERLRALKLESELGMRDLIRQRLDLPPEKRLNFLRVRLPNGGSAL